jgi:Fe2+ transport system protein B
LSFKNESKENKSLKKFDLGLYSNFINNTENDKDIINKNLNYFDNINIIREKLNNNTAENMSNTEIITLQNKLNEFINELYKQIKIDVDEILFEIDSKKFKKSTSIQPNYQNEINNNSQKMVWLHEKMDEYKHLRWFALENDIDLNNNNNNNSSNDNKNNNNENSSNLKKMIKILSNKENLEECDFVTGL